VKGFFIDSREWAEGRFPALRGLLLAIFVYIIMRHLLNPSYTSIFKGLNLGVHELGHFVFMFFGHFLHMAGGTILQLAVPLGSVFMFLHQRDYFAIAICFGWLSTNLYDVAVYVADARALELPLVSPFGGDAMHDWHYLLGELNILHWDIALGKLCRFMGLLSMLICLLYGGWLVYLMIRSFDLNKMGHLNTDE